MTWPELVEKLLDRMEAQGENMSKERAEFGVLMVGCCMKGCNLRPHSEQTGGES